MKVALIWPSGFDPIYVFPIALAYLKGNTSSETAEVRIIDCAFNGWSSEHPEFLKLLSEFNPDVVGVSSWSHTYPEALRLLKTSKKLLPKALTVIGGPHATSYPDATLREEAIDYLFRGESELGFEIFLRELKKQKAGEAADFSKAHGLVSRPEASSSPSALIQNAMWQEDDLDLIKPPDYEAAGLKRYLRGGYRYNTRHKRNAPIWFTRGCPYRCGFCSAPLQNGKPIRAHSVEYMVRWVRKLYEEDGIKLFNIIDDNFTFHLPTAKAFCKAMIDLGYSDLKFSTPNGIRLQRVDDELLELMKKTGWEYVCVAPESGSPRTLARMKKDLDPKIVPGKVAQIKKAGLKVHAFFILGYPGDTPEDLDLTTQLIRECKFDFFFLNNFQPLPGTPIYDELVKNGEIQDGLMPKNYSDGDRAYTPQGLQGFNFPRYVLKEYTMLALSNPKTIPYMFTLISPRMIAKKIFRNFSQSLKAI